MTHPWNQLKNAFFNLPKHHKLWGWGHDFDSSEGRLPNVTGVIRMIILTVGRIIQAVGHKLRWLPFLVKQICFRIQVLLFFILVSSWLQTQQHVQPSWHHPAQRPSVCCNIVCNRLSAPKQSYTPLSCFEMILVSSCSPFLICLLIFRQASC